MRAILTSVLELAGIALIVVGVALMWVPAAFVAAGVGAIVYAWRVSS